MTHIAQIAETALAYHTHHFDCPQCQAAGRLQPQARRCEVGQPLWADYLQAVVAQSDAATQAYPDGNHGNNDYLPSRFVPAHDFR